MIIQSSTQDEESKLTNNLLINYYKSKLSTYQFRKSCFQIEDFKQKLLLLIINKINLLNQVSTCPLSMIEINILTNRFQMQCKKEKQAR